MQESIPAGLQALMQASAVLQQTAAPTAPGPQGPQPTVAGKVMQQGMAQAGRQAGIANALMMQRAQQQQRMAQDPQVVAQMAAQMIKQGVGGLPVNMQFKEGGIIGFNSGGSSAVELEDAEQGLQFRAAQEEKELIMGNRMNLSPDVARYLAARRRAALAASYGAGTGGMRATEAQIAQATGRPVLRDAIVSEQEQRPQAGAPVQGLPDVLPREIPSETGAQLGYKPAPRDQSTPTPSRAPEPPSQIDTLISALERNVQGMPERPTIAQAFTGAKSVVPSSEAGIQKLRDIATRREEAIDKQANLEQQGIAALEEAKQRRKELLQQQRQDDSMGRLRSLFQSLYTRGNDYEAMNNAIRVREEQDNLADLAHAQAVLKFRAAEQARELGKFDRQEALEKDAIKLNNDYTGHVVNAMQVSAQLLGNVYNADARMASEALNRRSQELIEIAKLAQRADEIKDTRAVQRITALQAQLTSAYDKVNKDLDRQYGLLRTMLNTPGASEKIAQDAKLQKEFADYRAAIEASEKAFNIPGIRAALDNEQAKYTGMSNTIQFDAQGNRRP